MYMKVVTGKWSQQYRARLRVIERIEERWKLRKKKRVEWGVGKIGKDWMSEK